MKLTKCDEFKNQCIKFLEEKESKEWAARNKEVFELTEEAKRVFSGVFPLAEFDKGKMILCGDEFLIDKDEKDGVYLIDRSQTWVIKDRESYGKWVRACDNIRKSNRDCLIMLGLALVITLIIAYLWVYVFGWAT